MPVHGHSALVSHFAQFSNTESKIILWLVYMIHIYVLCKYAEIWPWSSSLKVIHRPPKYLAETIFGLFGDIFTLNADYIAWKLLKIALEVQYMMEYQHPVCWPWRGHGGRVVTLSPPTSEAGVRFPARPQVEKLVVACRWSAVYSTEPWRTVCTGFLCPSNYPSWYDLYSVETT